MSGTSTAASPGWQIQPGNNRVLLHRCTSCAVLASIVGRGSGCPFGFSRCCLEPAFQTPARRHERYFLIAQTLACVASARFAAGASRRRSPFECTSPGSGRRDSSGARSRSECRRCPRTPAGSRCSGDELLGVLRAVHVRAVLLGVGEQEHVLQGASEEKVTGEVVVDDAFGRVHLIWSRCRRGARTSVLAKRAHEAAADRARVFSSPRTVRSSRPSARTAQRRSSARALERSSQRLDKTPELASSTRFDSD
jgi:hypothetical protein